MPMSLSSAIAMHAHACALSCELRIGTQCMASCLTGSCGLTDLPGIGRSSMASLGMDGTCHAVRGTTAATGCKSVLAAREAGKHHAWPVCCAAPPMSLLLPNAIICNSCAAQRKSLAHAHCSESVLPYRMRRRMKACARSALASHLQKAHNDNSRAVGKVQQLPQQPLL